MNIVNSQTSFDVSTEGRNEPSPTQADASVEQNEQPENSGSGGPDNLVGVSAEPDESIYRASILGKISPKREVIVEQKHKDAFVDSIITGDRYTEDFSLLNDRLFVRIRCRSVDETRAILSYLRHEMAAGRVSTDNEYSTMLRTLLLIAQVDEINGVRYPELESPLYFTEKDNTEIPPAWASRIETWDKKPEAIVSVVSLAIADFEGRYWKMISESSNINFWNPGGSTGE